MSNSSSDRVGSPKVASIQDRLPVATPRKRRLMLVDDHAILRLGIRALLEMEPDFEIVAEAGTVDEALQCAAQTRPDLVITDLSLPGRPGIELIAELRERYPSIRILVLTTYREEEYIRACLSHGAHGYVLKCSSRDEMLQAIRTVHGGESFLCHAISAQVVTGFLRATDVSTAQPALAMVTMRERDVLTRVANGQANRQIAEDLGLSVKTVRKHRQNLMRKLELHNVAAVTAYAIRNGLVSSRASG